MLIMIGAIVLLLSHTFALVMGYIAGLCTSVKVDKTKEVEANER